MNMIWKTLIRTERRCSKSTLSFDYISNRNRQAGYIVPWPKMIKCGSDVCEYLFVYLNYIKCAFLKKN